MQHFKDWLSAVRGKHPHPPGNSPLEQLPNELLFRILDCLALKPPKAISGIREWFMFDDSLSHPNVTQSSHSLLPCLQVSRRMHSATLPLFYHSIKLVRKEFDAEGPHFQLLGCIDSNPSLAPLIRTLNLAEFLDSGRPWLMPRALALLPRLRSLHLQLGEMKLLDNQDIQKIFFGLPTLDTLVIENTCPKTHPSCLANVLRALESMDPTTFSSIRSLTCRSDSGTFQRLTPEDRSTFVDTDIFAKVLPRFPKLQALDLAYTWIDPKALLEVSSTARLQFLRITNCQGNDTSTLADFLATHPAVKSSLVVFDGTGVNFTQQDTTLILRHLPTTLRSLNLSGSTMAVSHVPQLQKVCLNLEELSVGHGLTMNDIEKILMGPCFEFDTQVACRATNGAQTLKNSPKDEIVMGPMRDAIAVCKLRRKLASVSPLNDHTSTRKSRVKYLNLGSLDAEEQGRITNSVLLGEHSMPLKLIAFSDIIIEEHHILQKLCGGCGWRDKWVKGMVWVERR